MIVELEDKSMTDFILFEAVDIKAQDPDVQNKYGYSSPCWEVSGKGCTGAIDPKVFIRDDEDKSC